MVLSIATLDFNLFLDAVCKYGLPSRVRGDQGTENYDVAWWMLNDPLRGPGCGGFLHGKAVTTRELSVCGSMYFMGVRQYATRSSIIFYVMDSST